jgi:hypothetical protein
MERELLWRNYSIIGLLIHRGTPETENFLGPHFLNHHHPARKHCSSYHDFNFRRHQKYCRWIQEHDITHSSCNFFLGDFTASLILQEEIVSNGRCGCISLMVIVRSEDHLETTSFFIMPFDASFKAKLVLTRVARLTGRQMRWRGWKPSIQYQARNGSGLVSKSHGPKKRIYVASLSIPRQAQSSGCYPCSQGIIQAGSFLQIPLTDPSPFIILNPDTVTVLDRMQ